jgi:hypothetical protein
VDSDVDDGERTGGQVWAEAHDGRLSSLDLAPRVMRRDPADIGSAIRYAANAALDVEHDDERRRAEAALPAPDALARIMLESRQGTATDLAVPDRFLDEALDILARIAPRGPAGTDAPVGHGTHADGGVRVVAAGGRVDVVELSYGALQQESRGLAACARTCVNMALDEAARDAAADNTAPDGAGADPDGLGARIDALRAESMRQFIEWVAARG